ncbi:MAG: hypothetical protein AAF628_30850 [Planctomycetota bacterium]
MLDDIFTQHEEELRGYREVAGNRRPARAPSRLVTRSLRHLGSSVLFACTLDGLLRRIHAETQDDGSTLAGHALQSKPVCKTEGRFGAILTLRNKVFAHTAYAEPRKEDGPGLRLESIGMLSGRVAPKDRDLHFGGFKLGRDSLPEISVGDAATIISTHMHRWWDCLLALSQQLTRITTVQARIADPSISEVTTQ